MSDLDRVEAALQEPAKLVRRDTRQSDLASPTSPPSPSSPTPPVQGGGGLDVRHPDRHYPWSSAPTTWCTR